MQKRGWLNSKIAFGICLSVLGLIILVPRAKTSEEIDSFSKEPVKISEFGVSEYKSEDLPRRIIIPDLAIDLEVDRARVVRGYWEVFSEKAGWGEGSGIPGHAGNQVIFAHAREGLFLPLKDIKGDTSIYVFNKDNWFSYKVQEIKEVFPNDLEVIAPTKDETLTLYTCSGFKDSKRLIVVAKRT